MTLVIGIFCSFKGMARASGRTQNPEIHTETFAFFWCLFSGLLIPATLGL
jgi:hypothetical protein